MKFNYGAEKKKFDTAWAQLAITYAEAGMSPEAIHEMYDYDWNRFKAARVEALHTQEMTLPVEMEDESESPETPLAEHFPNQLCCAYDTLGSHSRYWWLEELTSPCLTVGIPLLTAEDKELLTMFVVDEMTTREIAKQLNTNPMNVHRRLRELFSYFK